MPRTESTRRWGAREDQATCYPDELLPDLQGTLAALAEVEIRYEVAREGTSLFGGLRSSAFGLFYRSDV